MYDEANVRGMLAALEAEGPLVLLFLKSIEAFQVLDWAPGEPQPTVTYACSISNATEATRSSRRIFVSSVKGSVEGAEAKEVQDMHRLDIEERSRTSTSVSSFLVAQTLAAGFAAELAVQAAETFNAPVVPWAAVAAPLPTVGSTIPHEGNAGQPAMQPRGGQAFCFLPLPIMTALPVHINASFELGSNRRSIWYGSDMAGVGAMRSLWNATILEVGLLAP